MLPDLSAEDLSSIPERIGYLKDLGLDYGWGPTSIVQSVLEHIHIWTGLPWWASIILTGIAMRGALFKPMLDGAKVGAKMRILKPIIDPLRQTANDAARSGNQAAMLEASAELSRVNRDNGTSPTRLFGSLLQMPVGFGCYRLIEGMCHLPVPGLASESLGWIKDLTVPDPFYIMPLASSAILFLHLRVCLSPSLSLLKSLILWEFVELKL